MVPSGQSPGARPHAAAARAAGQRRYGRDAHLGARRVAGSRPGTCRGLRARAICARPRRRHPVRPPRARSDPIRSAQAQLSDITSGMATRFFVGVKGQDVCKRARFWKCRWPATRWPSIAPPGTIIPGNLPMNRRERAGGARPGRAARLPRPAAGRRSIRLPGRAPPSGSPGRTPPAPRHATSGRSSFRHW